MDINTIFKNIDHLYYECARNSGISETAYYILMTVRIEKNQCTQTDICERWAMSRQTVNSALKRLEKDGYLVLIPTTSGRSKVIELTDKGNGYVKQHIDPILVLEDKAWKQLSREKRELFSEILQEYYNFFSNGLEKYMKNELV